jgi:hypothetical protein
MSTAKIFFDFGDFTVEDFSPVVIKGFDKPFEEMTENEIQSEIVRIRIDIKTEMHWQKQANQAVLFNHKRRLQEARKQ